MPAAVSAFEASWSVTDKAGFEVEEA